MRVTTSRVRADARDVARLHIGSARSRWLGLGMTFAIVVLITRAAGGLRWESNDDAYMKAIADGTLSGSPSYRIPYSEELLGVALSGLYSLTTSIPWYGLHIIVATVAAAFQIGWILSRPRFGLGLPGALLGVLLSTLPLALFQQFTTAAAISCAAGFLVLSDAIVHQQPSHRAGLFLLAGWLLRPQVLLLTGAIWLPFLVLSLVRLSRLSTIARPASQTGSVVLGGVAANALLTNVLQRTDPGYYEWRELDAARGRIHGDLINVDEQTLAAAGFEGTRDDWSMFESWNQWDEDIFTTDVLEFVANNGERAGLIDDIFLVHHTLDVVFDASHGAAVFSEALFFAAAAAGAFVLIRSPKRALGILLSLLSFLLLAGYLKWNRNLPPRVMFAGLQQVLVMALFAAGGALRRPEGPSRRWTWRVPTFTAVLAGLSVMMALTVAGLDPPDVNDSDRDRDDIQSIAGTVIVAPSVLELVASAPLSGSSMPSNAIPVGWLINHPDWQERVSAAGLDDLSRAIGLDPNVSLLAEPDGHARIGGFLRRRGLPSAPSENRWTFNRGPTVNSIQSDVTTE